MLLFLSKIHSIQMLHSNVWLAQLGLAQLGLAHYLAHPSTLLLAPCLKFAALSGVGSIIPAGFVPALS
jgi:hypothetical protein